jgi:Fe-S-cluster-containing dehydrogenase component/CRP-like cAMP-binding protein
MATVDQQPRASTAVPRPERWSHPLDPSLTAADVAWLLTQPPLDQLDPACFSRSAALEEIVRHDSRLLRFTAGETIFRAGDYGQSAFIVLRGAVRLLFPQAAPEAGRASPGEVGGQRPNLWRRLAAVVSPAGRGGDRRAPPASPPGGKVCLSDGRWIDPRDGSEPLEAGALFGEMAAITRTEQPCWAISIGESVLLEIRWQGLRLLRRDPGFQRRLDDNYRRSSLESHLRETWLLKHLTAEQLQRVSEQTELVTHGQREWFGEYAQLQKLPIAEQIEKEPLVACEGDPANDLWLVRAGFARLSYRLGNGHRTLAYLGSGQIFGLPEIVHNWRRPSGSYALPYQESLRALGFVDLLRIPSRIAVEHILPLVRQQQLPRPIEKPRYQGIRIRSAAIDTVTESSPLASELMEFMVDRRLINGRQAMVIDLNRCTRCDECVRACADTHAGIPRFVRQGPQFGNMQITQACMHCQDPVCMIGCPTGAIHRNLESGVVDINPHTCIGCQACANSCPYDNIHMLPVLAAKTNQPLVDQQQGLPILKASKCDLCQSRWGGPACVSACPHAALERVDLMDLGDLQRWLEQRSDP